MAGKKGKLTKGQATAPRPMSTDEFLAHGLDTDSEDEREEQGNPSKQIPLKTEKGKKKSAAVKHKESLAKIKDQDPEFYQFLNNESQQLLNFSASDQDEDSEEEDSEDESGSDTGVHKPPKKLEVASDASDSDDEEDDREEDKEEGEGKKRRRKKESKQKVTNSMVRQWSESLRQPGGSVPALHFTIQAFKAAVYQVGGAKMTTKYMVEGSAMFNSIVRLCITDLTPGLDRILHLPKDKNPRKTVLPSTSKKWNKIRTDMKAYTLAVMELSDNLAEAAILNVVLRHVHHLIPVYACFPVIAKKLLKKLIGIWSKGEEMSRLLAFLSINKLVALMQESLLEYCLKQMYLAYVSNCKFTTPTLLPNINFMQRCMVEMFGINVTLTYQYAFIYIRQLAIHLRSAITVKKKDTMQAVYNWQYIHSLQLWVRVISGLYPNQVLEPLIYPLTQTIIGTIKLNPSARYYPLRFHGIQALNILSRSTNTFIPVLPFITEVFDLTDFNKKHAGVSMKPFNFACILKLNKKQLAERAFKDGVIDQMYELLMENLNIYAHCISFPELVLPAVLQLKQFLKTCKVSNYTKQIKQIVDRVQETSKVITLRRKSATMGISDTAAVEAWEARSRDEGTPIAKYYATWRKLRDRELAANVADKDLISLDERIPVIQRGPKKAAKATDEDKKEFKDLFDTDSDDSGDEGRFLPMEEKKKKKQKTSHESSDSDVDSLNSEELAIFDESGGDDDSEIDDDEEEEDGGSKKEDEDNKTRNEEESDGEEEEDIVEDFDMSDLDSDSD